MTIRSTNVTSDCSVSNNFRMSKIKFKLQTKKLSSSYYN